MGDVRATPKQYTVAFSPALRDRIGDCLCLLCAVKAGGAQVPPSGAMDHVVQSAASIVDCTVQSQERRTAS